MTSNLDGWQKNHSLSYLRDRGFPHPFATSPSLDCSFIIHHPCGPKPLFSTIKFLIPIAADGQSTYDLGMKTGVWETAGCAKCRSIRQHACLILSLASNLNPLLIFFLYRRSTWASRPPTPIAAPCLFSLSYALAYALAHTMGHARLTAPLTLFAACSTGVK